MVFAQYAITPNWPVTSLPQADPKLGKLIERAGPFTMRLKSSHSPFEALLESIVYQQLHGKAAAAILQRLSHQSSARFIPSPSRCSPSRMNCCEARASPQPRHSQFATWRQKTLNGTVPTLDSRFAAV